MTTPHPIIECVPNFSEGRDRNVINQIASAITTVDGVQLLHVDAGEAANRTVMTFAGAPASVVEAAFRATQTAGRLIDMSRQHGEHPRIGATDVLPLIPVSGVTLEECALMARQLAARIAAEAHIPCYCYEAAAFAPERRNLAYCRRGEYEALPHRLSEAGQAPDYGARPFDEGIARTGCTVVGARNYLIAVNFNLDTDSAVEANEIARLVRESGHQGKPGMLRATKALGWYIEEYQCAQVSMNLCDIGVTPLHVAYEEVCRQAEERRLHVTGTEIVGLVPLQSILSAGQHVLGKSGLPVTADEAALIQAAISGMQLSTPRPFLADEKIIEKCMARQATHDGKAHLL